MAVGCQRGKLSGSEARPGSRLVPGVGEAPGGENARNGGVWAGRSPEEGGRKVARADGNRRRTCLKWTHLWNLRDTENPGKPGCSCYSIGCEIDKLGGHENRRGPDDEPLGGRLAGGR